MMQQLVKLLHGGNYSCVIANGTITRTYTQRGVADLYELCHHNRDFLLGSSIADKVVGKGAATLMIYGGIKEVYADVISKSAYQLFKDYGLKVEYKTLVPFIINRSGDGQCPLETRCKDSDDLPTLMSIIENFIAQIRVNNK